MPINVVRDGKKFTIDDSEESLSAARAKGYTPLLTVTKDGKKTFDLNADDTDSVNAAFKKGYQSVDAFRNLEASRKEGQKDIGKAESFAQGVASAATFGFDDEVSAAIAAMKDGSSYDEAIATVRRMKKNREEANAGYNLAGNLVGGIAVPGLGAARAATTGGRIATGAAIGAGQGGLQGAGDSEASDATGIAGDVASGAAVGAFLGGATGGLLRPSNAAAGAKEAASGAAEAGGRALDAVKPTTEAFGRGFKEGAKDGKTVLGIDISSVPFVSQGVQVATGVKGAAQEILETRRAQGELRSALKGPQGQGAPGPSMNRLADAMADGGQPDVPRRGFGFSSAAEPSSSNLPSQTQLALQGIAGGDGNEAIEYIARQASAYGIDANDYKKLLQMSPERLEEIANFSKREAADDAAPLFKNLRDTFETVRMRRMKELKGKARGEFNTQLEPIVQDLQRVYQNAAELKTTQRAMGPINDAYEIIVGGKGADAFGFAKGDIKTLPRADLFDRLQAARSHIDDSIDWTAIKKGNRSATPVEKTLMQVRQSIDAALKGGSEAKIESDALFKKSRELEERFFKLASDKDGQHEVSLAKFFGDNDRAVKARKFMSEVEEFAAREDLPDELRESTKALADNLRAAMQTAEDKRLWQNFDRDSRGVSGMAVDRATSIMRGEGPALDAVLRPSQFLDLKAQANGMAKETFGKSFSQLNPKENEAIVNFLTWQRTQSAAKRVPTEEEIASKWQDLIGGIQK